MDNSPLSKLSAELRNHIWELALSDEKPVEVTAYKSTADPRIAALRCESSPLALTKTCKQIRAECTQMLYASTTFHISFAEDDFHDRYRNEGDLLHDWAATIGNVNAAALRKISITIIRADFVRLEDRIPGNIYFTLKRLLEFAASHPKCRIICRFHSDFLSKESSPVHVPQLSFDVQDGAQALRDTTMSVARSLQALRSQRPLPFPTVTYSQSCYVTGSVLNALGELRRDAKSESKKN